MDGGFPIAPTLSTAATPAPGLAAEVTKDAGFQEALTRNLGAASPLAATATPTLPSLATLPEITGSSPGQVRGGSELSVIVPQASTFPLAAAATPGIPPLAALPQMIGSSPGQVRGASNPTDGRPQAEVSLGTADAVPEPSGEAALINLPPSSAAKALAEVMAGSKQSEPSLIPGLDVTDGPEADSTEKPLEGDAIENALDVVVPAPSADQEAIRVETTELPAPERDALAHEMLNLVLLASPADAKTQMPAGAWHAASLLPFNRDPVSPNPPVVAAAQEALLPQLPAVGAVPSAFTPQPGAQQGAQLPSVMPQDAAPRPDAAPTPVTEALAGGPASLPLSHPAMNTAPQAEGQSHPPERDALPEAAALPTPVILPTPPRNARVHQSASQAADPAPLAGLLVELGITATAAQPSATPGLVSRTPDATAPPPMRQLAPIAIALAFTPGAASGFNLTLEPVELGRVEIRVQREGDGHSVRIMAERPETLALLQRDRHELDRSMTDAGLRVASNGIDFSLGSSGAGRDAPRDEATHQTARGKGGPDTADLKAETSPARTTRGLLDLNI